MRDETRARSLPRAPDGDGAPAVSVRGLVKSYGDVRALDGVDLDVQEGTVLGLLGPNGAGKTTMIRVLTTLLKPDAGSASVAGLDVVRDAAELRGLIGLAGQYAAVDENLTGQENLTMVGRLYGAIRNEPKQVAARAPRIALRSSIGHDSSRLYLTFSARRSIVSPRIDRSHKAKNQSTSSSIGSAGGSITSNCRPRKAFRFSSS